MPLDQSLFVTFFRPKAAWRALEQNVRDALIADILASVDDLPGTGVEPLAFGRNDSATDHRADYDYFCIYRVRDAAAQRQFEATVVASGWYDYFDQIGASGVSSSAQNVLASLR